MSELELLINKATDATLTNDNWQYILEVCDCITLDPELHTKVAIKVVQKRLTLKDANVILRTLSLLLAIAENCGSRMKQEIASTSFLHEFLVKKLGDRKLHKLIKFRIAEVIKQLNDSFSSDPSLKPIRDAYDTVKTRYSQYLKTPPSKPEKQELSFSERRSEEAELERALKLSVQEFEREKSYQKSSLDLKPLPKVCAEHQSSSQATKDNQPSQQNGKTTEELHDNAEELSATIANIKKVCALYDLISYEPDELSFKKGDIITVIESVYRDWWRGLLPNGLVGIFPLNYVTPVVSKSREELKRELSVEAALQDLELKKIEKLLALLSSNPDTIAEDEVTVLYNDLIPLRGQLAHFIDKYSSRKDELRVLHDQIYEETQYYNNLIDKVVNSRSQTQYSGPLPYPGNFERLHHRDSELTDARLDQQPTSSGFGNSVVSVLQNSPSGQSRMY